MELFSIKKIVSHVKENTLLTPNRYKITIHSPIVEINESITLNCHRCDIPGHSISSFDHSNIGPTRKIPNDETFDQLSTSFYNTVNLKEFKAINKWITHIGGKNYRMAYYNDIVGEMNIMVYDLKEQLKTSINIYEVYPTNISEIELSYTGEQPSEITVNWAYHTYEVVK